MNLADAVKMSLDDGAHFRRSLWDFWCEATARFDPVKVVGKGALGLKPDDILATDWETTKPASGGNSP